MEVAVPLVVGGLAGFSVATACGAEPRVPQVPPAELARQAFETVAEKLPRELVENDLLKKIARSWASLAPARRLGLVIEDASGRLAFLLLSSGVCCVLLTMVSLSPLGFALGLVAPIAAGAARDGFESRREQHDAEEAMPEAFTALSMSLASGHSLAQGMRFVGAHAQEPVHTEFLRVAAAIDCGISATDALDDLLVRIDAPGLSLVTLALKVSQRTGAPLADLLSEASSMVGERIELKRRLDVKTPAGSHVCAYGRGDAGGHVRGVGAAFGRFSSRSCDACRRGRCGAGSCPQRRCPGGYPAHYEGGAMSAPVAVAACLCALSVFVATGLDRADARKIAGACKREAVLVAAAGRSVVDALTARVKGAVGAGGPARVSLGEVSEMIDVVRLGLSAGLSFDAALEIFCANRRSVLALRLERACMAWQVGVGTREDELLVAARDLDVRALETFAITVGQALALGAPLAETLAAQSREIRAAHRAAVEREIERAPVKLLIPTGTLILPALLLSILGPLLGAGGMM